MNGTVRLVDRLAQRNLLTRGLAAGRTVPLHLTRRGEATLRKWQAVRAEALDELGATMPKPARRALVQAMATSLLNARRTRAEADATCRTCVWPACVPG